ncbi:ABC-2 type transport system ATP-binding protein [Micromonospora auratinigra]|uniref:ABC-2 type transport system ATP-binding protein n=2 Tax=Micromonospora auratinigra TaxID=261654 RepID=A0A1A8ZS67_9ACTN|nr:ABC-2 type transport system ATP-binding protein [Micromonospora auratinigra]
MERTDGHERRDMADTTTPPGRRPARAGRTLDVMDDELAISVRGLRKAYGDNVAVAGVDLDVHRGEVFALLGPNGAGKTTTVEILEGYRHRDAGEVRVLGTDPARPDPLWRSRVGIVLQGTGEFDELTVAEVVRHFSGFYPDADDPDKVVERVGLGGKAKARTHTLSGGQKRRLDVALGIIGRPELLFLDEPTTGFDPEARREFWELIRDLAAAGTTIVLTTHYLDEAESLADRVGVIAAGRVIEVAPPNRLGNRQEGLVTVSWRTPDGGTRTTETATPTALVADLAARFGGEVPGLTVTRPTLEDVYLRMIGHS